ncbi:ABC transporter ATP-binding protein/permease [Clostridium estertheticum]|uniref:ABC transporter ATP-binding protein/permease n=1 Tax=Clostridium estertheticum TaxID=238834 RepID=A0AA47EGL2_9CLOT|nr:ABC transporter ATP-binding protein [Clostridium estertheticum]MBU3156266.1 ABC transporter ATP-binding protein/permease [Clostridium estertheticum]MBU3200769.1 ABC transporter ATP-binding protein/permease [Clostridium estertheticum]WAG59836.1 ABC transporter ATP-binding protein/permease [Clostridium estertheticum]WAG66093.1 ABC transporter ATP-binding protein/permease [Clostridium estertheticum]
MHELYKDLKNTFVFLKGHYFVYFTGIIGMILLQSSSALLESYLLKMLLDIGAPESMWFIFKMIAMLVIYMILMVLLLPVFTFMFNGRAKYGHCNLNKAVYEKFNKIDVNYYEKRHSGEVLSVFENDTWVVAVIFMRHFRRTVASLATIVIYLIPMFVFDYRITLIILTLNLITLTANTYIAKKLKATTKEIQKQMSNMTVTIGNIVGGMSIIKMYQLAGGMREKFKKDNSEVSRLSLKNSKITALLTSYNFFISMLNILVFLLLGTIMVKHGLTTYGNILAIMTLQTALDANFREFGQYYPMFYNSLVGTERIYDFLDIEEEPLKWEAEHINQAEYIQFYQVNFGYTQDKLVLKDFNLFVKEGETLAIIGESGSGKSSVAKLLLGFYKINSGGISIGGKNLSDMTLSEIRDMIAYVPQEATLFNTTIMENIRYGRENATDEEIFAAARAANADTFIRQQPQGYETFVGERGIRLSGGQCQRIAIARAIIKNAPILLLDEATSALDSESERLIKSTIDEYGKTRTTIIIAHRLSTIENADRVFKMGEKEQQSIVAG